MKNKAYKNLSESLLEICFENELKYVTKLILGIDKTTKRTEITLILLEECGLFIGLKTKFEFIESSSLAIHEVEGIDSNNMKINVKNK